MFGKIKSFFRGELSLEKSLLSDKSGQASTKDLQVAALVILIEMASSDKDIAPQEAQAICDLMQTEFGIGEEAIPDLVQVATAARQEKGKIDEFVKSLNEHFNVEQRVRLLSMIWTIVMADGKVDKFEERFALQMQNRFQLTPEQAAKARSIAGKGKA
jgi:uncharacterized tellurite resistance protein B-like protein